VATFSANCIAPNTSSKVSSIHPIIFANIIVFSGFKVAFYGELDETTGDVDSFQDLLVRPTINDMLHYLRQ
jgi:hypothetical protein